MYLVDFIDENCNVICTHEVDVNCAFQVRSYVEKVLAYWKQCHEAWVFRRDNGQRYYAFQVRSLSPRV